MIKFGMLIGSYDFGPKTYSMAEGIPRKEANLFYAVNTLLGADPEDDTALLTVARCVYAQTSRVIFDV